MVAHVESQTLPPKPLRAWHFGRGEALAAVIGVEPIERGGFVIPGFTVRYHIGWHRYAAHYREAVRVSVP